MSGGTLHSFHLVRAGPWATSGAMLRPPRAARVPGLRHAECMMVMGLGTSIVSPSRLQLQNLAMFAAWADADALEAFLAETRLGRRFAGGWHTRLEFRRRWGSVREFADLPEREGDTAAEDPVVAVTLARLALPQVPRFIRWGRPVEAQVRDHPGTTLALAALRPPRTVSTFSVWRTQREMLAMVAGGEEADSRRHVEAMAERERRDFHREFTTLRFRALSEHGSWGGQSAFIPGLERPRG